jgi:hypothetical protein
MGSALEISLETAASLEALVEGYRKQARESAQKFDLERARSVRLYNENIKLASQVLRLEAEKRRLVEQLDEALLPRSM